MYITKQVDINLDHADLIKLESILEEHINKEVMTKVTDEVSKLINRAFVDGLHYKETSIRDESVKLVPSK